MFQSYYCQFNIEFARSFIYFPLIVAVVIINTFIHRTQKARDEKLTQTTKSTRRCCCVYNGTECSHSTETIRLICIYVWLEYCHAELKRKSEEARRNYSSSNGRNESDDATIWTLLSYHRSLIRLPHSLALYFSYYCSLEIHYIQICVKSAEFFNPEW